MKDWLESVYADGTKYFVSNPLPSLGEAVNLKIRMAEDAPIEHVICRYLWNGAEQLLEMQKVGVTDGLAYYAAEVKIMEPVFSYQFYLVTKNQIFYYTQKEITTYIPDHVYDFKILAGYQQPDWVKGAVFYQIFPDRFCCGNPKNTVKDGEYSFNGYETMQIKEWNTPAPTYEQGHCLDFYGGDLDGIRQKIPYLKQLGVTAVYLNPIFYAATVHRYDCLDYFSVDPHLGGDEALAKLTEALHEEGIKVILDVSINHTGTANRWFNKEGLFFDKSQGAYLNPNAKEREYYFFYEDNSYKAWFDVETLPTLNYTSKELRHILYEGEESLLKKWLKPPYSIDGWRFDVADVMARNNEIQLQHEVWPAIRESIKEVNNKAYILAEDWGDCSEFLQGKEWDSPMNYFGCGRPIRQFVGEVDLFHQRNEILNHISYKMTAEDLKNRIVEHFSKIPYTVAQVQFNLLDSHDVPRLHNNKNISKENYKGAVMMLFTLLGAANIYYGDEVEIDGRLEDTEGCRYPMPWNDAMKEKEIFVLYQTLAKLKGNKKAFMEGGMKILYAKNYVFSFARFAEREVFITVCSTNDEMQIIELPIAYLGKKTTNVTEDILGTPLTYEVREGNMYLQVPANQSYVFELK